MNVAEGERDQATAMFHRPRSVDLHLDKFLEPFEGVLGDLFFMAPDLVQAMLPEVGDRVAQANRLGDIGRPGLEFIG